MKEPAKLYLKRKEHYQKHLQTLERSFRRMIGLKLLVLLLGLAMIIFFIIHKKYIWAGGVFFSGLGLLLLLDFKHGKIQRHQRFGAIIRDMNDQSLWRFDERWHSFSDSGEELKDEDHPYTSDLDIFGKGSLFQLINASHTFCGRKQLASFLSSPPAGAEQILIRQEAATELAKDLKWRQWLGAYGMLISDKARDPDELILWAADRIGVLRKKAVILLMRVLSGFTVGSLIIFFLTRKIPYYLPFGALLLQFLLLKIKSKQRRRILNNVLYYRKNLELYQDLLQHIEKKQFKTAFLCNLKAGLRNQAGETAGAQLGSLVKIADQVATRDHALYELFNILTLWDYHCLIALESWKEKSGRNLATWIETIGTMEALASLAILRFDHPDWATPRIVEHPLTLNAENLGHPLLAATVRKGNDLLIDDQVRVLLITGSNMSGKSTFLRTAGINLVLAYAGAPVCAKSFSCSRMNIYTCMRISDNLEKNISTFYAEILRIKMIVEATSKKATFFLLDEIFKGTNSRDRHTGAKVLIKKLIGNRAVGLVSTHDLELAELEQECGQVRNYHFQEFFRDGELSFDYRLRPGVSTTRNALYLMRAAGIEIQKED